MAWRVAASLEHLLAQVNAQWPSRNKDSDGGIGTNLNIGGAGGSGVFIIRYQIGRAHV